tara:strand:+ start:1331 stop:2980 length:1650 start_codon:yes stop_codon:yes gene_type:complete
MQDIYQKVFERLLNEFSSMGGGAVGGVSTPLGTGPQAGVGKKSIYKKSTATDKKHRSKGKKKKTRVKSVQWYLKHGGVKSSKRSLKESFNFLFEARTPQLENLSKDQLLAFIEHMLGNAVEGYQISMTEKFSGQHVSVLVGPDDYKKDKKTNQTKNTGPQVFIATKKSFDKAKSDRLEKGLSVSNVDVMKTKYSDIYTYDEFKKSRYRRHAGYNWYLFLNRSGASRSIYNAFKYSYPHKMPKGTYKYFGVESLKSDDRKGDYISYSIPGRKEYAVVYSGDFTESDAEAMTNPKYNIYFMGPEQAVRLPEINQEFIDVLSSLRQQIQDHSSGSFKKFVTENIKPQLTELIINSLSGSLIAPNSPFEGLFVSIKDQIGFKIPNPSYGNLQRIQAPFAAAFEYKSVDLRAASQSLFEVAEAIKMQDITLTTSDQIKKNSTGYNILNYAVTLGNLSLRSGLRVFFTPESFQSFTNDIVSLINNPSKGLASKIIKTMSSSVQRNYNWHVVNSGDSYNNPNITTIAQAFDDLCTKIEILKEYRKQKAKEELELEK